MMDSETKTTENLEEGEYLNLFNLKIFALMICRGEIEEKIEKFYALLI